MKKYNLVIGVLALALGATVAKGQTEAEFQADLARAMANSGQTHAQEQAVRAAGVTKDGFSKAELRQATANSVAKPAANATEAQKRDHKQAKVFAHMDAQNAIIKAARKDGVHATSDAQRAALTKRLISDRKAGKATDKEGMKNLRKSAVSENLKPSQVKDGTYTSLIGGKKAKEYKKTIGLGEGKYMSDKDVKANKDNAKVAYKRIEASKKHTIQNNWSPDAKAKQTGGWAKGAAKPKQTQAQAEAKTEARIASAVDQAEAYVLDRLTKFSKENNVTDRATLEKKARIFYRGSVSGFSNDTRIAKRVSFSKLANLASKVASGADLTAKEAAENTRLVGLRGAKHMDKKWSTVKGARRVTVADNAQQPVAKKSMPKPAKLADKKEYQDIINTLNAKNKQSSAAKPLVKRAVAAPAA